jgi:hypothetical protein
MNEYTNKKVEELVERWKMYDFLDWQTNASGDRGNFDISKDVIVLDELKSRNWVIFENA